MSLLSSIFGDESSSANKAAASIFESNKSIELEPHVYHSHDKTEPSSKRERKKKRREPEEEKKADKKTETRVVQEEQTHTNDEEERTIFVGNLPLETTRKSLAKLFSTCGPIVSTRIRSVPVSGVKVAPVHAGNQNLVKKVCANTGKIDASAKSSVQAYVVFEQIESVEKALILNNTIISDRLIRVDHAKATFDARRTVFVGNLPYQADESSLQEHFARYCDCPCQEVEGVRIVRDNETFRCKGFGYVLFKERDLAVTALKRVHETVYMNRPLRVMVCGRRFKGKQGNASNEKQPKEPAVGGALKRILSKQHDERPSKKRRARGATPKKTGRTTGVSRRAAAEAKTSHRVKKIQKRINKGMGKARKR